MSELHPDRAAIVDFLQHWGGPWLLAAKTAAGFPAKHFEDVQVAADWAVSQNAAGDNVYFHVNPTVAPLDKKAKKEDIAAVAWLHVDLDPKDGDLTKERARLFQMLTTKPPSFVPPPTVVVDSGGGFWGFWRLSEALPIDGNPDEVALYNLQLERMFAADYCHNIDRVARLPGTVNFPDEKKKAKGRVAALASVVEEASDWSRIYDIARFSKAVVTMPGSVEQSDGVVVVAGYHPHFDDKVKGANITPQQDELLRALALVSESDLAGVPNPSDLSDLAQLQATYGVRSKDDLETVNGVARRIDPSLRGYSNSEAAVAFAGECLRSDTPVRTIVAFLLSPDYAIGTHALGQVNKLRAAQRAVAQAIKHANLPPRFMGEEGAAPMSQEHLALIFAKVHEQGLRYVPDWGHWYLWDGHKWRKDETLLATSLVRELSRLAAKEAREANPESKLPQTLCRAANISAIEKLARSDQRIAVAPRVWDADLWMLNTPEGAVNLKTGVITPPSPHLHATKATGVPIGEPGMPPQLFLKFLDRITEGDPDYIAYLQRMAGYFLTGDVTEHALFFAWGTGRNGKSVFTNTLRYVLGDYATSTPMETLTASNHPQHPTELADLRGARLVTAQETEQGRRWAEAKIKQMTGGDPIKARFMNQDFFEYKPQFKLFIAGNHKPGLSTVNEAMRRRIHLLPFTVTITEQEIDPLLEQKLRVEGPAILRWMVEGCTLWRENRLSPPARVEDATNEYLESQDTLGRFLDECTVKSLAARESVKGLYAVYLAWCEANAERPLPKNKLSQALTERGEKGQRSGGNSYFLDRKIKDACRKVVKEQEAEEALPF